VSGPYSLASGQPGPDLETAINGGKSPFGVETAAGIFL